MPVSNEEIAELFESMATLLLYRSNHTLRQLALVG